MPNSLIFAKRIDTIVAYIQNEKLYIVIIDSVKDIIFITIQQQTNRNIIFV